MKRKRHGRSMESKVVIKMSANVREDLVKKRFCFPALVSLS